MASVARTLARIKEDLQPFLPQQSIEQACREARHRWRRRQLGPVETIHLFIVQVLCFNTAMTALRHVGHRAVKASAYCKARMRLSVRATGQDASMNQRPIARRSKSGRASAEAARSAMRDGQRRRRTDCILPGHCVRADARRVKKHRK